MHLTKPYTFKSPSYLKFIRSKPCIVCRVGSAGTDTNIEAHHESCGLNEQKMGGKPHDTLAIPLCVKCHTSRTTFGLDFYRLYGIDRVSILRDIVLLVTEYLQTRKVIPGGG